MSIFRFTPIRILFNIRPDPEIISSQHIDSTDINNGKQLANLSTGLQRKSIFQIDLYQDCVKLVSSQGR
jgi:hypothetical protein